MKTTNDLMKILNSKVNTTDDLDNYLSEIETYDSNDFVEYLNKTLNAHGIKKNELVKKSNISRTYLYQILNGTRKPGRDNLISICISAGFTLDETIRCLEIINEGILYPRNVRDSIIIYAINHNLNIQETNELLYSKNTPILSN